MYLPTLLKSIAFNFKKECSYRGIIYNLEKYNKLDWHEITSFKGQSPRKIILSNQVNMFCLLPEENLKLDPGIIKVLSGIVTYSNSNYIKGDIFCTQYNLNFKPSVIYSINKPVSILFVKNKSPMKI